MPDGHELDARHLGPESVERYLRRHGLTARRSLSQNHLADGDVLERIVALAQVAPGERIVEVGPGLGVLTARLLDAGARVTAVELDDRLAEHLRERFADEPRLTLLAADFLDVEVASVAGGPWALVANVPYHITSPILHHVLGEEPRPERFVLMVQREVAERIAAPPGAMSYLSVFVQYHADVRVAFTVPAAAFEPAPAVDSAVLVGVARPRRLDVADEDEPLAARAGGLPGAPQDDPQRAAAAAPRPRPRPPGDRPGGLRHRPRPASPDPLRGRVAGPPRGPRSAAVSRRT